MVNVHSFTRRSWPVSAMLVGIGFLPSQPATVSLLPKETQQQAVRTPSYESFLPSANQLDPFLSLQFGISLERQSETQGSDSAVAAFVNGTVLGPDNTLGSGGAATSLAPTTSSGAAVQAACDEPVGQLQSAGKYWNGQTISGMLAAHSIAVAAGDRSTNLSPEGRAGAWCRPAPAPFAESSPLASRAFWQPIAVLAFGIIVFWLSRGSRLPS